MFLEEKDELRAKGAPFASHSAIEAGQVQLLLQKTATARFEAPKRPKLEPQRPNFRNTYCLRHNTPRNTPSFFELKDFLDVLLYR